MQDPLAQARTRPRCLDESVVRIPLISGSRVVLVTFDDDAILLAPPPPLDPLHDVAAAVGEALRYPLSGPSLTSLVTRGGRATIVVEPRSLPLPHAPIDPRQEALAAVLDELELLGMPADRHTIVVAGGLERRPTKRELETVLRPARARDFRGSVVVHDATSPDLEALELDSGDAVQIQSSLREADLVLCVTAAETSERGGASALLHACGATTVAEALPSPSLLAPSHSHTGALAGRIAASLSRHVPLLGVSLVLDHPRIGGHFHGYPHSPEAVDAVARSPFRRVANTLPGAIRAHILRQAVRELHAVGVFAGPPAVAHAEALLRGIPLRGIDLREQVDTLVVPLPWTSPRDPREPLNPITAAALGLGHALRLWRERSPLREGGTVVLLHDFRRAFGHWSQAPYRGIFHALREGAGVPERITEARMAAAGDPRAITAYQQGRAPHPLLPFVDWDSCRPALDRTGTVLVAGCRDAGAARALGFVPTHNVGTALAMARGVSGGNDRVGVLLAPPYAPLVVG